MFTAPSSRPFISDAQHLAQVVSTARHHQHLTQIELAARANVPVWFLKAIESAHPRAELHHLDSILTTLNIEPRALPLLPHWAFDTTGAYLPESNAIIAEAHTDEIFS